MQTIYIDISNKGIIPTIYTKQGDIGRKFEVVFKESNLPYSIPSDSVFSAWYKGDSGEGNYTDIDERSAFEVDGDRVVVELISQMLGVPGSGFICLVLSKADGGQIGSWNIPYVCEEVPGFDSEEATAYYTAFSSVLEGLRKNPENIVIDKTLSNSGEVADAKVTGEKIKELQESIEGLETPGGITDEEFAAKVEDIVVNDLYNGGIIRAEVASVASASSEETMARYHLIREDESSSSGYSSNVVTKGQHDDDIKATEEYAMDVADQARAAAEDEIALQINNVYLDVYKKTEVDAKLSVPQYEHIQTVTTTEVQKNIIFDGLNLDAFALFVQIPADSTLAGTCSIVFDKGGKNVWWPYVSNAISASNVNQFAAYGRNERGLAFLEYTNATPSTSTAQKYVNRAPFFVEGNTPFTKVSVSSNNNFPVGTKVELYGVKRTNTATVNSTEE